MRSGRRYTHDDTGLIHVEADMPAKETLGQLFTAWANPSRAKLCSVSAWVQAKRCACW